MWIPAKILAAAALAVALNLSGPATAAAAGLPTQTYPAGELLSSWKEGGRLATFHNGHLYMIGLSQSFVWDLSDPKKPVQKNTGVGGNGHRWAKFGHAFWKEYVSGDATPLGYNFLDLSALPQYSAYKGAAKIPLQGDQPTLNSIWTYPHREGGNGLVDVRTGASVGSVKPSTLKTVNSGNTLRIGNLWFYSPGDNQNGVAVVDVGNPANPKILSELKGDYKQYTTTYQVWRNYLILLFGDDTNAGGNNLIAIDYDDPNNLKVGWGLPNSVIKGMRYMMFQDEFGFGGRGAEGLKVNLETKQVVQRFTVTNYWASDFQWIPLGHLLVQTASEDCEGCGSQTHVFSQSDALDKRAPTVGYHLPKDGALNQPLGTVIGLVIAETLDDATISDKTLLVRPVGGEPIVADVVSYSYNVVNIAPRSPLAANTTYEVEVVAGGIKDVSGNGITGKKFYFSTGATLNRPGAGLKAEARARTMGRDLKLDVDFAGPYRVEVATLAGTVHTRIRTERATLHLSTEGWARGLHAVTVSGAQGRIARSRVFVP